MGCADERTKPESRKVGQAEPFHTGPLLCQESSSGPSRTMANTARPGPPRACRQLRKVCAHLSGSVNDEEQNTL